MENPQFGITLPYWIVYNIYFNIFIYLSIVYFKKFVTILIYGVR